METAGKKRKRARARGLNGAPAHCRWVDVIGRNRAHLERVRHHLHLPPGLVPLSLAEHLHPAVLRLRPAWFLATCFTAPSRRHVFTRDPLYVWLADYAIVTISPWARHRSALAAPGGREEMRDDFLCRVVEAAVNSHEEVGRHLHEAFAAEDRQERPYAWHYKERRVALFARLLDHQLDVLRAVGVGNEKMRYLHAQLAGLAQVAHHAERRLRQAGDCPLCRPDQVRARRRSH